MRRSLMSRLLEVQQFIEERPRTQKELVEHFGVDRQTVRRAIDSLSLFTNIRDEKDGRNTRYTIVKPQPLEFTALELATLLLAQQAIRSTGSGDIGSPFADSAKSLLTKVRARIAPSLRKRLDAFSEVYGSAVIPAKDFSRHFDTIEKLVNAAADSRVVVVSYGSLIEGKVKERRVSPLNVYLDPDGATLKMLGYDELRKSIRVFAVDHIKAVKVLAETFIKPEGHDLKKFLEDNCFNGIHGEPITVRLRVTGVTAKVFAERSFHPTQRIMKLRKSKSDGSLAIEMTVARGRGLERFIQSWLPEIEVLSPPELHSKIQKNLQDSLDRANE